MTVMSSPFRTALLGAALLVAAPAFAAGKTEDRARIGANQSAATPATAPGPGSYLIDFENLTEGNTLGSQYSAMGVNFFANAYEGSDSPNGGWATNTDMTIVAISGSDVGGLGTPTLVSGNILRSYDGWFSENGDPSFVIAFDSPISSISIDFAGVAIPGSTGIDIFTPDLTYITTVFATGTGQQRLTYSGSNIGYVGVTPGEYNDWVGVDNIAFTVAAAVPEPETYGLMALGLGVLAIAARRRQR